MSHDQAAKADLAWILVRVGSWSHATWLQHLRFQFGDARAEAVLRMLVHRLGNDAAALLFDCPRCGAPATKACETLNKRTGKIRRTKHAHPARVNRLWGGA